MKILKLSLKEIKKKKLFSLLMLLVCVTAMQTVLSAVTNAASTAYQKNIFETRMDVKLENVLHLHYQHNEENQEFTETIRQYIDYIKNIPGVETVGQFDMMGMYFSELKTMEEYQEVNKKFLQGTRYESNPAITQLLSVDEELLPFIKGNITEYNKPQNGHLPLYVSERFENTLPVGMILTDEYNGDQFEIVGYFSKNAEWVDENDLIRFPLVSLDGWFIAPLSEKSKSDIMTQLSMLHNTYVMLSDNADVSYIKAQIAEYPLQHGFAATSSLLSEEYEAYRLETESFAKRQIILAIFISIMACSSIVAAFTTNALLKKNQYGVLIANGFTLTDISIGIATEIFIIIFSSGLLSWVIKWIEFESGKDLFKNVLLTAHIYYSLPLCIVIVLVLTVIAAALPAVTVFRYQPCELIGGIKNDNH